MTAARTYRIGEVHSQLRTEFPDLELSKIRYYEDQGLVQPKRTKSKYRVFSAEDIEVLREALRLRAKNVALPDVRRRLVDRGLIAPEAPTSSAPAARAARPVQSNTVSVRVPDVAPVRPLAAVPSPVVAEPSTESFATAEFIVASGLSERQVNDMQAQGFLAPEIIEGRLTFSSLDLLVAQRALVLLAQGVAVKQLTPIRRIVQLEMDFVRDITAPLRNMPAVERELETARVAGEISALRAAVYTAALMQN